MSIPLGTISNVPFITKGIGYRNDFLDTGSLILDRFPNATIGTYFTDGDILTLLSTTSGDPNSLYVDLSLSGSPIQSGSFPNFAVRCITNNFAGTNRPGLLMSLFSGSTQVDINWSGSNSSQLNTGSWVFFSGSFAGYISTVDKVQFSIRNVGTGTVGSGSIDFIMFYNENFYLNYVSNQGKYELARILTELNPPMREQGIVQSFGSQSPTIDIDGVFINDANFTAQQYRNKLVSVWTEGTWQWLNLDFIGAKFIPEDISFTELAGVVNYYQWTMKARQFAPISATNQNYNLS